MSLPDLNPPVCPYCQSDAMAHVCFSHIAGTAAFKKNGWYCDACGSGPYRLGAVRETDASATAAMLLAPANHSRTTH
ncbi:MULTISPECIES: hypothetical protein [Halomonas]|uniref:hypothetical protein n=1 Tax=Halomonas TaxID=2745 RepID=UPI003CF6F40A